MASFVTGLGPLKWAGPACGLIALLLVLTACAEKPDPGSQVDLRQQVFKRTVKTFEASEGMARGRVPYKPEPFLQTAISLQALAREPWAHFALEQPNKGSRAKPEVWQKPEDFKLAIQSYELATDQLLLVAKKRDPAQIQAAVSTVEQACAACHKAFRK